jgi:hypothetical protein
VNGCSPKAPSVTLATSTPERSHSVQNASSSPARTASSAIRSSSSIAIAVWIPSAASSSSRASISAEYTPGACGPIESMTIEER